MSWKGDMLKAGISSDGKVIDLFETGARLKIKGTSILNEQQNAIVDAGAITAYTAPLAAQGVTVVSEAATDLDDTAAALHTLVDEVSAIRTAVNSIIAALETHGIIAE